MPAPREGRVGFVALACAASLLLSAGRAGAAEPSTADVTSREVVYRTASGTQLKLHFSLPPGWQATDRRPAILFFFGGGWTGGKIDQFEFQANYLAQRGMVAARADYRVKSRQDVRPDDCVRDAQAAIRFLRTHASQWGVDPERIVAAGGSAGGHLAACLGTVPPLEPGEPAASCRAQALVLFNPVLQFTGVPELMSRVGGDEAVARAISPTDHLAADTPPAILFYGDRDRLIVQGEDYVASAKQQGVRATLVATPGMGHGYFNRSPYRERTLVEADKFLASLGYLEGPPTLKAD